jgi:hypothetical protein
MVFCYLEDEGISICERLTQNQFSLISADLEDHYLDFNKFNDKLSIKKKTRKKTRI